MIMEFDDLIQDLIDTDPTRDTPPVETDSTDEPIIENEDILDPITEDPIADDEPELELDEEEASAKNLAATSFELLKQYGVVSLGDDFEFDGTPESFEKALTTTKENLREETARNLWETLPEDFKPLLQYALAGGKDLQSYLEVATQPNYAEVDLSDENNQRQVMYDYWALTSNYSPEKINRMIDALDKAGDLESEALETARELAEIIEERKETLIKEAAQAEEIKKQQIKEQTMKITSVIEALPSVDKTRKNRLQTFMFTPVKYEEGYSTGLNRTINQVTSNPEHFVQLADFLADYNPEKGFSFERLKTQLKTETNKNFKDIIDKLDSKSKVKGTPSKQIKEDFD